MTTDSPDAPGTRDVAAAAASGNLVSALLLSVTVAIAALATLIAIAGPWDLLAVTRLLDPLIEGGIIQYHDRNPGFIAGLPDVKYYLMSQDPIDWRLVSIAALLMLLYPCLRAVQFDRIARACGSVAGFGAHIRAYFHGDGLDRVLPFNMGRVAIAKSLQREGVAPERAATAVFLSQGFVLLDIVVFGLVGLFLLGWAAWFSQVLWALVFLGLAWYIVNRGAEMSVVPAPKEAMRKIVRGMAELAQQGPGRFIEMCLLSLLSFAMLDLAVFTVMMAFDTEVVLINVEPSLLLMGIVGGYIAARIVPVTPGGIGQWELGFATGLYLGGADVSLALVSIALLSGVLRILTGLGLMSVSLLRYGGRTNLQEVCAVFTRVRQPAAT